MSKNILVTGGTGTLGREAVRRLVAGGYEVRVLTRHASAQVGPGATIAVGDLVSGDGIDAALTGIDTVVHLATTNGRKDIQATRRLVEAARRARVGYFLYMSIVGVDLAPLPYYRAKLAAELAVIDGGVPWTILRATQFPDLLVKIFRAQRRLPVLLAPKLSFQPVDVRDVADRIAALVVAGPGGRAEDLGGPEVIPGARLAADYLRATRDRRRVVGLNPPGRIMSALRAGANLTPEHADGRHTWAGFLAERVGPSTASA